MRPGVIGAAVVASALVVVGGAALVGGAAPAPRVGDASVVDASETPAATVPSAPRVDPDRQAATGPDRSRPVRVSIPAIGVDAPMTDLGIDPDGAIEVPEDPREVGWLETTSLPGEQGPAVLAGHLDSSSGPAVFIDLTTLREGEEIVVTRRDGSDATFTVDGVRTYAQDDFPTEDVYGPVPGPALRLITCGGAYDAGAGGYQDNVVVYAS